VEFRVTYEPSDTTSPYYHEFIQQPFRMVRNFPTLNADTIRIENIKFEARPGWRGVFTFDYSISEKIPIPFEQYSFEVVGMGNDSRCTFGAQGTTLTQQSGEHSILLDLPSNLFLPYSNCLTGPEKLTYTSSSLRVVDNRSPRNAVYSQDLGMSYTVWK
jgi:hypothetical protein